MIHLALAFFLLLTGAGSRAASRPPTVNPSAQARTFLNDLASGHYSGAAAMSTAQMQAAAPAATLQKLWKSLVQKCGAFKSYGQTAVVGHAQGLTVTRTNADFAKTTIGLQVTVESDGKIGGLFIVQPNTSARLPAEEPAPDWRPPPYARTTSFHEVDVTVGSAAWALPGFLTLPNGHGPFAAVVLVPGSGSIATDADETFGPNKPFKDLAWGLASHGIAVLRYAKRTYYYPRESAALTDFTVAQEYVEDAQAGLALLTARPDIARSRIFVLGHSQGGSVAPRIAASPLAAGMISLAGAAQPLQDSVVMQMKYLASLHPPRATAAMVQQAEADARAIESPSLRPGAWVRIAGSEVPASYMLDLRHYSPPRAAAALHKPVLVLQGGKDYNVTQVDYRLWQQGLAGDRLATFHFYPQLTHEFIAVSGPPSPADAATPGHVDAQVVSDIAAWVQATR